jgi:iron uptake system component EfeO
MSCRVAAVVLAVCLGGVAACTGGPGAPGGAPSMTAPGGSSVPGAAPTSPAADPVITAAVLAYRAYLVGELGTLRTKAGLFTDAVRDGGVDEAKRLYPGSRASWERVEPVIRQVSNVGDSAEAGWHRLERLLWARATTGGGKPDADQLDRDLATAEADVIATEPEPREIAGAAAELIRVATEVDAAGTADPYSHTDLWDLSARVDGARSILLVLEKALTGRDKAMLLRVRAQFAAVDLTLRPYQSDVGSWQPFTVVPAGVRRKLRAELATLRASLDGLPAALGL